MLGIGIFFFLERNRATGFCRRKGGLEFVCRILLKVEKCMLDSLLGRESRVLIVWNY